MFKGSIVALITPFRYGKVDEDAFQKLVEWYIARPGRYWEYLKADIRAGPSRARRRRCGSSFALTPALVLAGSSLVNENDGPDRAVRLLEGIIETLEAPSKRPDLQVVGDEKP